MAASSRVSRPPRPRTSAAAATARTATNRRRRRTNATADAQPPPRRVTGRPRPRARCPARDVHGRRRRRRRRRRRSVAGWLRPRARCPAHDAQAPPPHTHTAAAAAELTPLPTAARTKKISGNGALRSTRCSNLPNRPKFGRRSYTTLPLSPSPTLLRAFVLGSELLPSFPSVKPSCACTGVN